MFVPLLHNNVAFTGPDQLQQVREKEEEGPGGGGVKIWS